MSTTLEDRVILLLREESGDNALETDEDSSLVGKLKSTLGGGGNKRPGRHGFWEQLDRYTGISSQRWRKAYARRQRPTPDMIEALARMFPTYAFWLATGITDATNGHVAPLTEQTFPERLYTDSYATKSYFRAELTLMGRLFEEGNVNVEDDGQRMFASERNRPLAHWWDSVMLGDVAYRIAATQEYDEIRKLWDAREDERKDRIRNITDLAYRQSLKDSRDLASAGLLRTPMVGIDPRTKHQNHWDLFYEPTTTEREKFARYVLNVHPNKLTDEQTKQVTALSFTEVLDYLKHHGLDEKEVVEFKGGMIRYGDKGLLPEEVERFERLVMKHRTK